MKNALMCLFTCVAFSGLLYSKGGKTAITDCSGEQSNCSAVVNAIGDVIKFDALSMTPKFLGKITQEKTVDIDLPEKQNSKMLYSLIPSSGESAGKLIFVLFDNVTPKIGSRHEGKTDIKVYRQFMGDRPTQWTEVGEIITSEKELGKASVTIKPDGTATTKEPATGKTKVFALGIAKLK